MDPEISSFVSPFWSESFGVTKRDVKLGEQKVAQAQDALRALLRDGEELRLIVPSVKSNTGYDCLAVMTSERLLDFKGTKARKHIQLSDVSVVKKFTTRNGDSMIQVISRQAAPFEAFSRGNVADRSTEKFWQGTLLFHVPTVELINDFERRLDATASR
jgi:hypothetical protein